ncbi:iron complex transport system permease protein [Methylopila capsulata]|uniref:Iron ABC transporter permease n=1 Tax=Methylopila capsulata TaxID=61654 RepID=A0A9W6MSZ8_9HYPH|nr:iron ABC transporter permease [Methylopila capsulata]MBM7852367.1 iron complex transport system permease protein [Methylopila capsulata]GLK56576.1 iron ABC transporter permease [Methylopila capsulata]
MTWTVAGASALVVLLALAGLRLGDVSIAWADIFAALADPAAAPPDVAMIVFDLRLPRVLSAGLVGMALGVAGAITQALLRNPLAEPGTLGVNAGAALAVTVLTVAYPASSPFLTPWAGFVGAGAMTAAVWALSWRSGATSLRIILIGVGLSSLAGAGITLLTALGDARDVHRAFVWLSGSVYDANWAQVSALGLWLAPTLALCLLASRALDVASLGAAAARSVGQDVIRFQGFIILLCAMVSGAAVAVSGLIAFVGLIAPHAARRLVGWRHSRIVPAAALIGAAIVMTADLIGRVAFAPIQIPAGVLTALIGAPVFGFALWRARASLG